MSEVFGWFGKVQVHVVVDALVLFVAVMKNICKVQVVIDTVVVSLNPLEVKTSLCTVCQIYTDCLNLPVSLFLVC